MTNFGPWPAQSRSVASIGAPGIEPFEVFLARLDQRREFYVAFGHGDNRRAFWRHQGADVGVEADRRASLRALQGGDDGLVVARFHGGERADVQMVRASPAIAPGNGHRPS